MARRMWTCEPCCRCGQRENGGSKDIYNYDRETTLECGFTNFACKGEIFKDRMHLIKFRQGKEMEEDSEEEEGKREREGEIEEREEGGFALNDLALVTRKE